MLRIYFTGDDIARTRLARGPDPMWETILSLHILGSRRADAVHGLWRGATTVQLRESALTPGVRTLLALNPPTGYFPDFLTPSAAADGLQAGLDAIASTPTTRVRRDLSILAEDRPLPTDVSALGRGEAAGMAQLIDTMRAYFDFALAPHWARIEAVIDADRTRRVRAVAARGAEGLLDSLRPAMRWGNGELLVDYPVDQEMELRGRGLLLVPSYFCWRYPVTLLDPDLPPVLIYPAEREPAASVLSDSTRQALGALLGSTRAAALAAIGDGCSTTDLARRIGVSAAGRASTRRSCATLAWW